MKKLIQHEFDKFRDNGDSSSVAVTSGMELKPYDYMSLALTDSVTETYTFKSGGSGGTTTNTIVIVYTDSGKGTISSVTKT